MAKRIFKRRTVTRTIVKNKYPEAKKCRFCRERVERIDYKDTQQLQKLTNIQGKLFSRKRSGNCAKHQRIVKIAIKRARFLALMPYLYV